MRTLNLGHKFQFFGGLAEFYIESGSDSNSMVRYFTPIFMAYFSLPAAIFRDVMPDLGCYRADVQLEFRA
jgi:hypothetical protein